MSTHCAGSAPTARAAAAKIAASGFETPSAAENTMGSRCSAKPTSASSSGRR